MKLLIGVVCMVLLCAGCSGGSDAAQDEPPEGFVRYAGAGVSFVHPAGWEIEEVQTEDGEAVTITAPEGSGPVSFAVGLERGGTFPADLLDFADYVEQWDVLADLNLRDREVIRSEPFDVPGGDDARLIEVRYEWGAEDAVRVRQYDVLTLQEDRNQVPVFRISGPEAEWDVEVVETMLDSLRYS